MSYQEGCFWRVRGGGRREEEEGGGGGSSAGAAVNLTKYYCAVK